MIQNLLNDGQVKALRLLNNAQNCKPTDLGGIIISRNAAKLLELNLIDYAPRRPMAYRLTKKGKEILSFF